MGKSNKGKGKRAVDARGYGQSAINTTNTNTATTSTSQVAKPSSTAVIGSRDKSQQKHENIKSLVAKLREDEASSTIVQQANNTDNVSSSSANTVTVSSDRFVSKLKSIVNRLMDLGFKDEQLDLAVQQLGFDITLESALDYLCLNVPTLELPPLFTDGQLRDSLRRGDNNGSNGQHSNSLTVLKFAARQADSGQLDDEEDRMTDSNILLKKDMDINSNSLPSNGASDLQRKQEEQDAAEQKAWLLQMYGEYENVDETDNDDNNDPKEETHGLETAAQNDKQESPMLTPDNTSGFMSAEEIELQTTERELQELQDDVNNEANNYMRSKVEIKQLKQQCNIMKKDIASLRRKVERIQREKIAAAAASGTAAPLYDAVKEEELAPADIFGNTENDEEMDDEQDHGGNIFDIFGDNAGNEDPSRVSGSNPEDAGVYQFSLPERTSLVDCPIPKYWTGTTPKKTLEETCKKKKLGQPKFSRLPSKSGYRLSVAISKKVNATEWIALATDFTNNSSLQDYLAAQALYAIDSTIPVYLLFPPALKDIWLAWLAEDKLERDTNKVEEDRVESERIQRLLLLIKAKPTPSEAITFDNNEVENEEGLQATVDHAASDDSWEDRSADEEPTKPAGTLSGVAQKMKDEFVRRQKSKEYSNMVQYREGLPMASFRKQFLQTVKANPVTVLCAETGAGKSK
jgi:ATP-dependent RNA helicase DHX29